MDLLRLVPASMTALSSTPQRALSTETPPPSSSPDGAAILHLSAISAQESTEDTAVSAQEPEWPKAALISAFRVIKLLADEFLESMGLEVIGQLLQCLSVFAAQTADVNISLTSVEMLWKVSDVAMAPPAVPIALAAGATAPLGASVGGFELFQMMLHCLEDLSLDPRPEVSPLIPRHILSYHSEAFYRHHITPRMRYDIVSCHAVLAVGAPVRCFMSRCCVLMGI